MGETRWEGKPPMLRSPNGARHASSGAVSRWATTQGGMDARNVMAAERTFLAWIRTCLTLLATGTAISSLPFLPYRELRGVIGLACVVATVPVAMVAHGQWREWCAKASEHGLPRPRSAAMLLLSVVLLVTATLAVAISARLVTPHNCPGSCRRPALRAARPRAGRVRLDRTTWHSSAARCAKEPVALGAVRARRRPTALRVRPLARQSSRPDGRPSAAVPDPRGPSQAAAAVMTEAASRTAIA